MSSEEFDPNKARDVRHCTPYEWHLQERLIRVSAMLEEARHELEHYRRCEDERVQLFRAPTQEAMDRPSIPPRLQLSIAGHATLERLMDGRRKLMVRAGRGDVLQYAMYLNDDEQIDAWDTAYIMSELLKKALLDLAQHMSEKVAAGR